MSLMKMVAFVHALDAYRDAMHASMAWREVASVSLSEAFDALPAEQSVGILFDQNEKDLYDAIVEVRGMVAVDALCSSYLDDARKRAALGLANSIVKRNPVSVAAPEPAAMAADGAVDARG